MAVETQILSGRSSSGELVRSIDWKGAFWVASGVPALVLFSIGGIAGTTGKLAFLVWTVSMVMGFIQSFTYAEIAGLFPNKSGGASIYGATAWLRYSKLIAPLSVWCNWFAWSPGAVARLFDCRRLYPQCTRPGSAADSPDVLAWVQAHASVDRRWIVRALPNGLRRTPARRQRWRQRAVGSGRQLPPTPAIRNWTLYSRIRSARSPSPSTRPSSSARC